MGQEVAIMVGFDELWKLFIRPPRDSYRYYDLGPTRFEIKDRTYQRSDFEVLNERSLTLKCSMFEPVEAERPTYQLPCVIYLHGNCSSRIEALGNVPILLSRNMCVVCFDFSGCGKSEGKYISLGWFEKDDLACVVEHIRKSGRISKIGLWGRSMGAVTALLYLEKDANINAVVLDSPFSDIHTLAGEIASHYAKMPTFITSATISLIRNAILTHGKFDIEDIQPIAAAKGCIVPALFMTANEDYFVRPRHSLTLFDRYRGDKSFDIFQGDHNSPRPYDVITRVADFLTERLESAKQQPRLSFHLLVEPQQVEPLIDADEGMFTVLETEENGRSV